jgi:hypothetical protein
LNFSKPGSFDIARWTDRVKLIDAQFSGVLELPVLGAVSVPSAVLVRPDGYVAWVSEGGDQGREEALSFWFGAPA